MTHPLYVCIHAAEFPAQALLRLRPELRAEPVAVLDGIAPEETVCSINVHARRKGADLHLTKHEAETIVGLVAPLHGMRGRSAHSISGVLRQLFPA